MPFFFATGFFATGFRIGATVGPSTESLLEVWSLLSDSVSDSMLAGSSLCLPMLVCLIRSSKVVIALEDSQQGWPLAASKSVLENENNELNRHYAPQS